MSVDADRRFDAVICDIDGCLGPERAADPLDARDLARVRTYNDAAHELGDRPVVTVCTGRPQPYAEAVCRLIGNRRLPIVCEMGVWLWWPADNIYDRDPRITPEDIHAVHEASDWIEKSYGPMGVVQQPGKTCSLSLYHPDTERLMAIKPELEAAFEERRWPLRVSSTWLWINCDLAHVSKSTGIERLMEASGLTKQRLAGIGDTMGDMAIREHVALFACPANADESLKPRADFVSDKPEVEGVLDILQRLAGPS